MRSSGPRCRCSPHGLVELAQLLANHRMPGRICADQPSQADEPFENGQRVEPGGDCGVSGLHRTLSSRALSATRTSPGFQKRNRSARAGRAPLRGPPCRTARSESAAATRCPDAERRSRAVRAVAAPARRSRPPENATALPPPRHASRHFRSWSLIARRARRPAWCRFARALATPRGTSVRRRAPSCSTIAVS